MDSGGESWAELSALKMKWIESTKGKILVNNNCSQTTRYVFTSQFFLAFRSSCKQSVRGDTDTFALSILAWKNAASSVVCIFYTFRATHLPKPLIFKVLLLQHTPMINPAVHTLALLYIKGDTLITERPSPNKMYLHLPYI